MHLDGTGERVELRSPFLFEAPVAKSGKAVSLQGTTASSNLARRSKLYIFAFSVLTLAHRASTAFLALSLRCSAVNFAALAGPPFFPPLRPSATAAGFFRFATFSVYVSGHEKVNTFLLTIRDRSRILKL